MILFVVDYVRARTSNVAEAETLQSPLYLLELPLTMQLT